VVFEADCPAYGNIGSCLPLFYRSLPNWLHLQETDEKMAISVEEMRSLNLKESQILTSNLSAQDAMIPSHEIISDPIQLKLIGNLHESLVSERWYRSACSIGCALAKIRTRTLTTLLRSWLSGQNCVKLH